MRIVRVRTEDGIAYGAVEPEGVRIHEGSPLVAWEPTERVVPFGEAQLLAPVFPTKVVGIEGNYSDPDREQEAAIPEEPVLFLKPATSVVGPGTPVVVPPEAAPVHHQAALAVVIGALARDVPAEDASRVILGYTGANDVTAPGLAARDGQWTRAKGFDTFCPLGPAIETELDPLEGFAVLCRVNGETRQKGSTAELLFGVAELIAFVSGVMTLLPGDVLLTGTPPGAGPVAPGDRMEVEIEAVGALTNPVVGR